MAGITLKEIILAFAIGILPTFLWLWFWFNQDKKNRKRGFLLLLYGVGMISLFAIFPFKTLVERLGIPTHEYVFVFAAAEEIIKVTITAIIAFRAKLITKPTDYTVYLVTLALGLSALENALYLVQPLLENNITLVLFTGNLRFIGATLLHTVCVAIVGIMLGMTYYDKKITQWMHGIFGLGVAISLHAIFNYFILVGTTSSTLIGLIGLWLVGVIVFILFKRIQKTHQYQETSYFKKLSS